MQPNTAVVEHEPSSTFAEILNSVNDKSVQPSTIKVVQEPSSTFTEFSGA